MKYIFQFGFICILSFVAELLHEVIPIPVPASVYGLVILFLLLCFKVVKVEQIEDVAGFMLAIMPIFFISPSVSLITSFSAMKGSILVLVVIICVSTVLTLGLTGFVTQFVMRLKHQTTNANEVNKITTKKTNTDKTSAHKTGTDKINTHKTDIGGVRPEKPDLKSVKGEISNE